MTNQVLTTSPTGLAFVDYDEGLAMYGTVNRPGAAGHTLESSLGRAFRPLKNGYSSFYIQTMLPPGIGFETMNIATDTAYNFLQCAGTPERLTIEHARPNPEDPATWFDLTGPDEWPENVSDILGYADPAGTIADQVIPMSGNRAQYVHPTEVFTLDEVIDIYVHYFDHGYPPLDLHRRTVPL